MWEYRGSLKGKIEQLKEIIKNSGDSIKPEIKDDLLTGINEIQSTEEIERKVRHEVYDH